MAEKKKPYIVKNPSLYFRVNDALQQLEVDSEIELTKSEAKNMLRRGWVTEPPKKIK